MIDSKNASNVLVKKYEVTYKDQNNKDGNFNNFKHILHKSGVHYCNLEEKDTYNNKYSKLSFQVRENNSNTALSNKLTNIRQKIENLGLELKEVNKTKSNNIKNSDIIPSSVRWDTKPVNYNKKNLVTNYNSYNKGHFNRESEGSTLVSNRNSIKKNNTKSGNIRSDTTTSANTERN